MLFMCVLTDHHFGNRAASTGLEDLMEHMNIHVEWRWVQGRTYLCAVVENYVVLTVEGWMLARSNFKKLAEPQNEDLQAEFRQGGCVPENNVSHGPRNRRKDKWNGKCVGGGGAVRWWVVILVLTWCWVRCRC